jgi:hypothetical protein
MRTICRISLFAVLGLAATGCARLPKHYVCHRARGPLAIDGRLDDAAWAKAPWTDAFVDIEGDKKPRPPLITRAKLLWDDQYLYIAAALEEPDVWANLKKHDAIVFRDPDFEVFIDPDGDAREYYELEFNALNTVFDLFLEYPYREGGSPAHHEWDLAGLKSAVAIEGTLNDPRDVDHGWSIEMALPWSSLAEHAHRPSPPRPGDAWRINFSRVEWQVRHENGKYQKVPDTKEDNWVWSPQGVVDMHQPEHWGFVEFAR